jgi:hypothetical protein
MDTTPIPAIGQPWPGQGGIYAGLCRGRDGQPDHHLILAAAVPPKRLTWKAAQTWAAKVEADGHKDFAVPDRHQSAVLFGNVADQFEPNWYWTSTQHADASSYAWYQGFDDGTQYDTIKSYEARVRAVRRLPVDPSILWSGAA